MAPAPSYGEVELEEEGSKSMVLTTHTIMKVGLMAAGTALYSMCWVFHKERKALLCSGIELKSFTRFPS